MSPMLTVILVVGGLAVISFFIWAFVSTSNTKAKNPERRQRLIESLEVTIVGLIGTHLKTLKVKRLQLVTADDYGIENDKRWQKEVRYFFENIIAPTISSDFLTVAYQVNPDDGHIILFARHIDSLGDFVQDRLGGQRADEKTREQIAFSITEPDTSLMDFTQFLEELMENSGQLSSADDIDQELQNADPNEYEHLCARAIGARGWNARVTSSTGDQGVDVICDRDGKTIVVQCKKYSSPVGNKAVQEVIAGKAFYKADGAAVISNAGYTKSARDLAAVSGVVLMHHSQIERFSAHFMEESPGVVEEEEDNRELWGDQVYATLQKWAEVADGCADFIIYRRGNCVHYDIGCFYDLDVVQAEGKYQVMIALDLAKIVRNKELGDSVDWRSCDDKDLYINVDQILFFESTGVNADDAFGCGHDLVGYQAQLKELESKARSFEKEGLVVKPNPNLTKQFINFGLD